MIEFKVNDMSCGGCVNAVTRAVKQVDPAAEVDINLDTKRVRINGSSDIQALRNAISDAGFTPEPA
jgi:copper chaperone